MKTLYAQIYELENRLQSLQYENEQLKIMLYRMIASNDKGVELSPYSDDKAGLIKDCKFYMRQNVPHIYVEFMKKNVQPNNSEKEI
jgi:hypothetical protein